MKTISVETIDKTDKVFPPNLEFVNKPLTEVHSIWLLRIVVELKSVGAQSTMESLEPRVGLLTFYVLFLLLVDFYLSRC